MLSTLQMRVKTWLLRVFVDGGVYSRQEVLGRRERSLRFLEEAIELVQATGLTEEEITRVVRYVMGRPTGEISQEIGGTLFTLLGLCVAEEIDAGSAIEKELSRAETPEIIQRVRNRQREKRVAGVGL